MYFRSEEETMAMFQVVQTGVKDAKGSNSTADLFQSIEPEVRGNAVRIKAHFSVKNLEIFATF